MRDEAAAAAKTLGMTDAQLRTALESGKSLADLAKSKNVSVGTLVKALVGVAEGHLATEVKAGRLTQAQADKIKAMLTQRITDRVNHVRPARDFPDAPRRDDTAPSVPVRDPGTADPPGSFSPGTTGATDPVGTTPWLVGAG